MEHKKDFVQRFKYFLAFTPVILGACKLSSLIDSKAQDFTALENQPRETFIHEIENGESINGVLGYYNEDFYAALNDGKEEPGMHRIKEWNNEYREQASKIQPGSTICVDPSPDNAYEACLLHNLIKLKSK